MIFSVFACGPRLVRFLNILGLVICSVTVSSSRLLQGAESAAVRESAAGRDPAAQVERDWVDNRWSRTEVGQFLASSLELSGVRIAKGLSIKVGDNDEGTVCYDTRQCAFRAAWLGGFLRFDPARFGLIGAPRIAGDIALTIPSGGWHGTSNSYTGLHLHGKRVVLEYIVDGIRILESPWLEHDGRMQAFTRSFEVAPCTNELGLMVGSHVTQGGRDQTFSRRPFADSIISLPSASSFYSFGIKGAAAQLERRPDGALWLHLAPSERSRRFKLLAGSSPRERSGEFDGLFQKSAQPETLSELATAGPARWLPELKTVGQRGFDRDILTVDTLTVPYDNPWKALMFFAGVDFTPDGTAFVCSIHGDVWRVTGVDDRLRELRWKRFGTGLFQPLGLKVRDGQVFVLGRDQITRLLDLNGDAEADFYQNFCNLVETLPGHHYVTSLETDSAGNFYYVDSRGAHRISPEGTRKETLATGFRNPNGLGVSPDGRIITVAPQQGEWTPSSLLCEIKGFGYYGYGGPKATVERPLGYDPPLCWIPHSVDNSGGSQVWVPHDHWSPFAGQMLHLLWGRCGLALVLRDVVEGISQGAIMTLPARFLSGPNRGTFNRRDGNLYVAGSTGWQTSAVKEGALQRVRFTDKPVYLPMGWHAYSNGLELTFTQPLDPADAEDVGSYSVHQWNYRYAAQYGSKDWSVATPEKEGHDEVTLRSAGLLPDGKTVFLEIPDLRPVMQMEIKYNLRATDGQSLRSQLWLRS